MPISEAIPFGLLLKRLLKRAGLTQRDLATTLNYSHSFVSNLEKAKRLPDLDAVKIQFIPALGLQDDPETAMLLIERAAMARGERPQVAALDFFGNSSGSIVNMGERLSAPLTQVPLPPIALIGRAAEVDQICKRLLDHGGRLMTLVGPPGIGKTTLALAVASNLAFVYGDGAVFVALAEISDPVLVASAMLSAIGIHDSTPKPPKDRLIAALRRKNLLFVLDNCEQIREVSPLIAELLTACPLVTFLATSRERLHLRAELRYQVPPLSAMAAMELFEKRATAIDSRFELPQGNRPIVEAICQKLDCLPLAIELCAAQTDLLSLPQLLARLQNHTLDVLIDGAHDLPPRQRTLRLAIQCSYDLLSESERKLFRSLGVFVGGFDVMAVVAVNLAHEEGAHEEGENVAEYTALLSTLHALLGKSLVRVEREVAGEQRFLLLETLREFALEQLHIHNEVRGVRRRHYLAYRQRFRMGDSYLRGPDAASWLLRLEVNHDNLRAAMQWALGGKQYIDMAWLHIASLLFWFQNGHRYEAARWLVQLLPHRQMLPEPLRLAILCDYFSPSGELEGFPAQDSYAAEIVDLLEICPYLQLHAHAWYAIAFTFSSAEQTGDVLQRAVMFAQMSDTGPQLSTEFCFYTDSERCIAANQWGYGGFLVDQGELAQATGLVMDSLQRFRRYSYHSAIGDCLSVLGIIALLRNDIAQSHAYFQEAIKLYRNHNVPVALAYWLPYFGLVTAYRGNPALARPLLNEGLSLCLEMKNIEFLVRAYMCQAEMALWEGNTDEAVQWLQESVVYHVEASLQRITIDELQRFFVAARLATTQGQYQQAALLFGAAEAAHRHIHYVYAGPMLPLVNAAREKAWEKLGTESFDDAFVTGQHLSLLEAFTTVLRPEFAGV